MIRGAHEFIGKQAYNEESEIKYRCRVPSGSEILDERAVTHLERIINSYQEALSSNRHLVTSTSTPNIGPTPAASAPSTAAADSNASQSLLAPMNFPFFYERQITVYNPSDVYLPTAQFSNVLPDPVKSSRRFCFLDRVVNVGVGGLVPLGLRGTLIGWITTGPRENDIIYEVLFDREFAGALRLHGSGPRCYRLGPHSLLNLTAALREMPPQRPLPDAPIYIQFPLKDTQSLEKHVLPVTPPRLAPLANKATPVANAVLLSETDVNIAQKTYKRNTNEAAHLKPAPMPQIAPFTVHQMEPDQVIGVIAPAQLISRPDPVADLFRAMPSASYPYSFAPVPTPFVSLPATPPVPQLEPAVSVQVLPKRPSRSRTINGSAAQQPAPPAADDLLVEQSPQVSFVEATASLPAISSIRLPPVVPMSAASVTVASWDEAATAPLPPRSDIRAAPSTSTALPVSSLPTVAQTYPTPNGPTQAAPATLPTPPQTVVNSSATVDSSVVALNKLSLPETVPSTPLSDDKVTPLPKRPLPHKSLLKPVKPAVRNLRNAILENLK